MNPRTNEQLARKIEILNKKYFDGKLRVISSFATRRSGTTLGHCRYNRKTKVCKIEINPLLKGYDISEVIIHELIHAKDFTLNGTSSHGYNFKKFANEIFVKSEGKYDIARCCTDKKLSEVVAKYDNQRRKERLMKKYNLKTEKEYDDFIKAIMTVKVN